MPSGNARGWRFSGQGVSGIPGRPLRSPAVGHGPMTVPVLLSWSGGKDSALSLQALRADPEYEVVALLTSVTREYDRVSIHGVRRTLLERQADALGLPLIEVVLEPRSSDAAYQQAFLAALETLAQRFPAVHQI